MKAVIVGGGVIGGGWVARFLLNGWDVVVFDPDPDAERKVNEVLAGARHALPALYDYPLPEQGVLRFEDDLAQALQGADWVQESVPERLALKHKIHAEIQRYAPEKAVIASSTSGFKPSELNESGARVIVAHPFNPVYLLPLVELVGERKIMQQAEKILQNIGMFPLKINKQIEAHIADRLLEAVWRESLWLVHDGIATTHEIDDAIRMGFGLRWAQMGLFETFRIAGGEAGMRHFMQQFGPALEWHWTKLMDVPPFNDALVDLISGQSDAQSGHYTIRELERIRDDNLVDTMRALKKRDWGAGKIIRNHEAHLTNQKIALTTSKQGACTMAGKILSSWLDYNGHLTEFRYAQIFADSSDRLLRAIGVDIDNMEATGSFFTVSSHITYKQEMRLGQDFSNYSRILNEHPKKLHLYHQLQNQQGEICAVSEQLMLYIDHKTRKSAIISDAMQEKISNYRLNSPMPEDAGKV